MADKYNKRMWYDHHRNWYFPNILFSFRYEIKPSNVGYSFFIYQMTGPWPGGLGTAAIVRCEQPVLPDQDMDPIIFQVTHEKLEIKLINNSVNYKEIHY